MKSYALKDIRFRQWLYLLFAFTGIVALFFWGQSRLGLDAVNSDQFYYKIFIDKMANPELFLNDPVYSTLNPKFYTPAFLGLIAPFFNQYGFLNTLFILMPVFAMAYLMSCFIALYKLTGKIFVSALVAILSGQILPVFPVDQWGVYSISAVMPRTVFLIFAPLLFYCWLSFQKQSKKLYGLFFVLGVITNFHPVSGLCLSLPMFLSQIIIGRFSIKSFKTTALCGIAALIPMLPFAFTYFGLTEEFSGKNQPVDYEHLMKALEYRIPSVTLRVWEVYSNSLFAATAWLGFALWSIQSLWKDRESDLSSLLFWFSLSSISIFIGFYGVNFLIFSRFDIPPLLIDLVRVTKFMALPVLFLIALWFSTLKNKKLVSVSILFTILITFINIFPLV